MCGFFLDGVLKLKHILAITAGLFCILRQITSDNNLRGAMLKVHHSDTACAFLRDGEDAPACMEARLF